MRRRRAAGAAARGHTTVTRQLTTGLDLRAADGGMVGARRALLPLLSCNLSGLFTYLPEPGSRYEWSTLSPSLIAVAKAGGNGGDPWSNATGDAGPSENTLTLSFHYPANLGGRTITKNGTVAGDCSDVVMHDVQPGCIYRRCSAGACPSPPTPATHPASAAAT